MCTLTVLVGRHPRFPLIVAANRDERLDRRSTGPRRWEGAVPLVAGRDEEAKGTWLGVNAAGVAVGLTNHWTGVAPDPRKRSRGEVVVELLRAGDLDSVRRALRRRDPEDTNPFLLLAVSRRGEGFWCASADGLRQHPLQEGVTALGNRLPGDGGDAKPAAAQAGLETLLADPPHEDEALREHLAAVLATHVGGRGPTESPCVHTDRGFGTVSSTIIALGEEPSTDRLWHAPGPPCRTPFASHHELLQRLAAET